mgnify:CR=1 FL=1
MVSNKQAQPLLGFSYLKILIPTVDIDCELLMWITEMTIDTDTIFITWGGKVRMLDYVFSDFSIYHAFKTAHI